MELEWNWNGIGVLIRRRLVNSETYPAPLFRASLRESLSMAVSVL